MTGRFEWKRDRDEEVQSYIEDLEGQFETLKKRFNQAAENGTSAAKLSKIAVGCAALGKNLFEIKTSPGYAEHMERFMTFAPAEVK